MPTRKGSKTAIAAAAIILIVLGMGAAGCTGFISDSLDSKCQSVFSGETLENNSSEDENTADNNREPQEGSYDSSSGTGTGGVTGNSS